MRGASVVVLTGLTAASCGSTGSAAFCSQAIGILQRDHVGEEQRFAAQLATLQSDDIDAALQVSIDQLRRQLTTFADGTGSGWSTSVLVGHTNRVCESELASQTVTS
jgi:hypothetical protein